MELETAVRYRIHLIVIIANTDGNMGSLKQKAYYPEDYPGRVTTFLNDIRYERIMGAFSGCMEYLEHPDDIKPAVKRALGSGKAACINIKVDPHAAFPGK